MMGVSGLRDAFNAVGAPAFTCTMALLAMERKHDIEFTVLTFRGTAEDGTPFEVKSDDIRPGAPLGPACAATAQRMLDQRKPAP